MSNIRTILDELESLLGELGDAAFRSQGGAMAFRDKLKIAMENLKTELERLQQKD